MSREFTFAAGMVCLVSLNRIERRSLAIATALVLLGTGLRLGLGPGPADTAWQPLADVSASAGGAARLRAAVEQGVAREQRAAQPLAPGERIDPNFADEIELRRLPGIGPAKAAAIVRERLQNGPFGDLRDLERVPGLGPKTVARLSPSLQLSPGLETGVPDRGAGSEPIDLNRATADELASLPGIGPALADRIIEFRLQSGGFRDREQLLEIRGIGPGTMDKIRSRVRIH